jgi:hypothetical protein
VFLLNLIEGIGKRAAQRHSCVMMALLKIVEVVLLQRALINSLCTANGAAGHSANGSNEEENNKLLADSNSVKSIGNVFEFIAKPNGSYGNDSISEVEVFDDDPTHDSSVRAPLSLLLTLILATKVNAVKAWSTLIMALLKEMQPFNFSYCFNQNSHRFLFLSY